MILRLFRFLCNDLYIAYGVGAELKIGFFRLVFTQYYDDGFT
jgi:hypothetical protein